MISDLGYGLGPEGSKAHPAIMQFSIPFGTRLGWYAFTKPGASKTEVYCQ